MRLKNARRDTQDEIRKTRYARRDTLKDQNGSRFTVHVSRFTSPKGFTLIELLVVISIFGVLAALILANFNAARERARDVERKSDLDQIKKALRMYYNDNNQYPEGNTDDDILACGAGPAACTWGSAWTNGLTYMKTLPQDPNSDAGTPTYSYQEYGSSAPYQDFCLWATLENASDADIEKSQTRCSSCSVGVGDYVVCAD